MPENCLSYGSDVTGGQTYDASSYYTSTYLPEFAFDDDFDKWWVSQIPPSSFEWLEVDFGSGTEKAIAKLRLYHDDRSIESPEDFTLKASNTGGFSGEEVDLLTVSGYAPDDYTWYEWEFYNLTTYRYYRIHITAFRYFNFVIIPECEMMECTGGFASTTTTSTTTTSSSTVTTSTTTTSSTTSSSSSSSTQSTTTSTETTYTGYTYPTTTSSTTSTTTTTITTTTSSTTSSTASSTSTYSTTSSTSSTASSTSTYSTTSSTSSTASTTSTHSTTTSSSTVSTTTSSSTTTTTTAPNTSFCVFRDVTIPTGSVVTRANMYLTAYKTDIPTPIFTDVYFSDEDNPSPPTDKLDLDGRPMIQSVSWVIQTPWFDNVTYKSPDLSAILQQVIDRSGFSSGNNVLGMIKHVSDTSIRAQWGWPVENSLQAFNLWAVGFQFGGNMYASHTRFVNVNIPQGATITSCRMKLYNTYTSTQTGDIPVRLFFESKDNPSAYPNPGTTNEVWDIWNPYTRLPYVGDDDLTTPGVPWTITDTWISGDTIYTPDISSQLQQIVDRPGWSSGNACAVYSYTTEDWIYEPISVLRTYKFRRTDFGDGISFKLEVTWSGGSGTFSTKQEGTQHSAQMYSPSIRWNDPSLEGAYRFWSAMEHLSGTERACLRVHYREAEQINTPVMAPAEGFQLDTFDCSISIYPTDAAIYYTTDGSTPDENDTLYTTPFSITSETTVKAKAYKQYWLPSDVATKEYTFPGLIMYGDHVRILTGYIDIGHQITYRDNYLYVFILTGGNHTQITKYNTLNDTWATELTGDSGIETLGVYVDNSGFIHIFYRATTSSTKYATNASGSWVSTQIYVNTEIGGRSVSGFITLDSSGYVHIFFRKSASISFGEEPVIHATNASGSWQNEEIPNTHNSRMRITSGVILSDDTFSITCSVSSNNMRVVNGYWGNWTQFTSPPTSTTFLTQSCVSADNKVYHAYFVYGVGSSDLYFLTNETGSWVHRLVTSFSGDISEIHGCYGIKIDSNGYFNIVLAYRPPTGGNASGGFATNRSGDWVIASIQNPLDEDIEQEQLSYGMGFDEGKEEAYTGWRVAPFRPLTDGYWVVTVDLNTLPS